MLTLENYKSMSLWSVNNNFLLGDLEERSTVTIVLPLVDSSSSTELISGTLPLGLRLSNNQILGTPLEVNRPTTSMFVIRAKKDNVVNDRTFYIKVSGSDQPVWITDEGKLPIGPNNTLFILDNSLIDYQLLATDRDLPANDKLEFYLTQGELPPGIELTLDGKLIGIVDPILALDVNVVDGGYDATPYSEYPYDFAVDVDENSRVPRKINRNYEFEITVTDNVTSTKRRFEALIVGDDFARADNTIMKAANGIFTADMTFLRTPLWLTPANLGVRRANNYLTIFLDTYDSNSIAGEMRYVLESLNPDGTPSLVPPGLILDESTGELAGRVPYQPAISRDYKFTVNAIRFTDNEGLITVFGTFIEDTLAGSKTIKIAKVPITVTDGLDDLRSLVGQTITIDDIPYVVESVNGSNNLFDTITLTQPLQPNLQSGSLTIKRFAGGGTNFFFVNELNQFSLNFYNKRTIKYSDNEFYKIDTIFPYIEWEITGPSTIDVVNLPSGVSEEQYLSSLLSLNVNPAYITLTKNSQEQITKINMLIPSTAQNRNSNFIRNLFETTDSMPFNISIISQEHRVKLDKNLERNLNVGIQISISVTIGGGFNKTFVRQEYQELTKRKTFTIRLIGEVETTIGWITPSDLGVLQINRISTLSVKALSTSKDTVVNYSIVSGSLPPGLTLSNDGEVIGKVPATGTTEEPGLVFIDQGNTTFDSGLTTFDREWKFTVVAKDRFDFNEIEREFVLLINDDDSINYTNIYAKPFLKIDQRNYLQSILNDSSIFDPIEIYRPNDPSFGVQTSFRTLIYAGVETKKIEEFVAASAKNHKKKNFFLGDIKTAVAKQPGTNNIIYEVVYVELIDPSEPKLGFTKDRAVYKSKNRLIVNSDKLEKPDDSDSNPYRFRPVGNTLTADSDAIKIDQRSDRVKYLSNISNMRKRLKSVGITNNEFLPLWMRTAQEGSLTELGYVLALPLAYTKPGFSNTLRNRLLNENLNLTQINFEIDRYIVDRTLESNNEQFILFANYSFNI
jgi:hypothetical protein